MFEKAICINLDHRADRWTISQEEFSRFGIDVERFPACAHENAMKGIHMSYHRIFQENAGKQILVLEDDVRFTQPYSMLLEVYNDLPHEWWMFYLGGNATKPLRRQSTWLFRAIGVVTTHAILYSGRMTQWLADNLQVPEVVDRTNTIDVWLANTVQPQCKSYIAYPNIAEQHFGYSDICKMDINYKYFNNMSKKYYS